MHVCPLIISFKIHKINWHRKYIKIDTMVCNNAYYAKIILTFVHLTVYIFTSYYIHCLHCILVDSIEIQINEVFPYYMYILKVDDNGHRYILIVAFILY